MNRECYLARHSAWILSWFWITVACAPAFAQEIRGDYLPLAPEARWVYRAEWRLPDGTTGTGRTTNEVIEHGVVDGVPTFKMRWFTEGFEQATPRDSFVWKTDEGVHALGAGDEAAQLVLPSPLELGQEWVLKQFEGEIRYRVVGLEEPEGLTRCRPCLRIDATGYVSIGDVTATSFSARDVGMVRQIERYSDGSEFVYELEEYRPGGDARQALATVFRGRDFAVTLGQRAATGWLPTVPSPAHSAVP